MAVEHRSDRGKWGFRYTDHSGKRRKLYRWDTESEAQKYYEEFQRISKLPASTLRKAATEYLADSLDKRSMSRCKGIGYNLERWILPYFGGETSVSQITSDSIEAFIKHHVARGVKISTIRHYVKDLRALLNWCKLAKRGYLENNPVDAADLDSLKNWKTVKLPLDTAAVDRGIAVLRGADRLYVDILRYMGLRRDEGNRIQAKHFAWRGDILWLQVMGTKTEGSLRILPVPPVIVNDIKVVLTTAEPDDYITSRDPKVKRYDRRKLFQKIQKAAGCHVTPKDLRDYFASVMDDFTVASQMLGHTNPRTTAIYLRQVQLRMYDAVKGLGGNANVAEQSPIVQESDGSRGIGV